MEALADDYNKSFRYDDAARTYDDLLAHVSDQLDRHRLQGTMDDSGVMHLLRGVPAQTITWQGPVRLKTERDVIGSLVTELEVNGVRGSWLLDIARPSRNQNTSASVQLSVLSFSFSR